MLRDVINVPYVEGLVPLGAAVSFLWFFLMGVRPADIPLREFRDRAALSVAGHLRRRPDDLTENALRDVFVEFDRELTLILANRTVSGPPEP